MKKRDEKACGVPLLLAANTSNMQEIIVLSPAPKIESTKVENEKLVPETVNYESASALQEKTASSSPPKTSSMFPAAEIEDPFSMLAENASASSSETPGPLFFTPTCSSHKVDNSNAEVQIVPPNESSSLRSTPNLSEASSESSPPKAESVPDYSSCDMDKILTSEKLDSQNCSMFYQKVVPHWFYLKGVSNEKGIWKPFSKKDSDNLEEAFQSKTKNIVPTNGSRYDVDIKKRLRFPVYWEEESAPVCRATWFYKLSSGILVPYDENIAEKLEENYKVAFQSNLWYVTVEAGDTEMVHFNGPTMMFHQSKPQSTHEWTSTSMDSGVKLLSVKRGIGELETEEDETSQIDHLILVVHGIGPVCDMKFQNIILCVQDFRKHVQVILKSHFKSFVEAKAVGRVEVLPICWHKALHGESTGMDEKLRNISLHSIPILRNFINDTLIDILFYTSHFYCQIIIDTVTGELNRIFQLFSERNPYFGGTVSVVGHSLGSIILFDILAHQPSKSLNNSTNSTISFDVDDSLPSKEKTSSNEDTMENSNTAFVDKHPLKGKTSLANLHLGHVTDSETKGIFLETAETDQKADSSVAQKEAQDETDVPPKCLLWPGNQALINYPVLSFDPSTYFALGAPIGLFVLMRGLSSLGEEFRLPTCPAIFNIFHPYDPVAYRIETLVNPALVSTPPCLIPHHKGRKRIHLEFKEMMQRMGTDIKSRFLESVKTTWNSFNRLRLFSRDNISDAPAEVFEEEMLKLSRSENRFSDPCEQENVTQSLGSLNKGRRIDYVLQERPIESFNEYLFALTSHLCYWESDDTILLMLKELYAGHPSVSLVDSDSSVAAASISHPESCAGVSDESSQPPGGSICAVDSLRTHPNSEAASASELQARPANAPPAVPTPNACTISPPPTSGFIPRNHKL